MILKLWENLSTFDIGMVDRLIKEVFFEGTCNSSIRILRFMKAYLGFVVSSWSDVSATCSTTISRFISTRSIATIPGLVNNIFNKVQALNNLWDWVSNCKCAQDTVLSKRQGQQRYLICLGLASDAEWVVLAFRGSSL